jgi:molybdenum cofactor cytidylyltransferase
VVVLRSRPARSLKGRAAELANWEESRLSGDSRVAALLLAAGAGSRMGGPNKLHVENRGHPLVRHLACVALSSRCRGALAVLGARADEVMRALEGREITLVQNDQWKSGMASSLRAGVAAVATARPTFDAVLVMLADQPQITSLHLDALIDAHEHAVEKVIASRYAGIEGVPALFPRRCFDALQRLEGDTGARALVAEESAASRCLAIEFEAATLDLDTPDDYAALELREAGPGSVD